MYFAHVSNVTIVFNSTELLYDIKLYISCKMSQFVTEIV